MPRVRIGRTHQHRWHTTQKSSKEAASLVQWADVAVFEIDSNRYDLDNIILSPLDEVNSISIRTVTGISGLRIEGTELVGTFGQDDIGDNFRIAFRGETDDGLSDSRIYLARITGADAIIGDGIFEIDADGYLEIDDDGYAETGEPEE